MARRHNRRRDHSRTVSSGLPGDALDHLVFDPLPASNPFQGLPYHSNPTFSGPSTLMDVEDLRTWTPHRVRSPKTLRGLPARLRQSRASRSSFPNFNFGLGFAFPKHVVICVRRKQRKEVFHALRLSGRSGARSRKPRRTQWSAVRC